MGYDIQIQKSNRKLNHTKQIDDSINLDTLEYFKRPYGFQYITSKIIQIHFGKRVAKRFINYPAFDDESLRIEIIGEPVVINKRILSDIIKMLELYNRSNTKLPMQNRITQDFEYSENIDKLKKILNSFDFNNNTLIIYPDY